MLPYGITVGFRKTIFTCSCGFFVKQNYLKQLNVNKQNVHKLCTTVLQSKLTLELFHIDVNINNANRFCLYHFDRSKTVSKQKVIENTCQAANNNSNENNAQSILELSHKKCDSTKNTRNIPTEVWNWLFTDSEKPPIHNLSKKFPEPKLIIHNIFNIVENELKSKCLSSSIVTYNKQKWICSYQLKWPENQIFKSLGSSKLSASSSAALKCLYWLHLIKRIKNRTPIVYDESDIKSAIETPEELKIGITVLEELNDFLNQYEFVINEYISSNQLKELEEKNNQLDDLNSIEKDPISKVNINLNDRNKYLKENLENRIKVLKEHLPIFQYKFQILKELEKNQLLIIKGDTGCGKSTQVPQFIIDHMIENNSGSDCNMIVTQPRRISAISLAQRVAFERNEKVGNVIGYQVRLNQMLPKQNGAILFCTTGILLKKLQSNPTLKGYSHVIIDEAHERTIDTDMLLILLKRAVEENSLLKVVIMSATLNADLFQEYFKCNTVEVPGRLFSVQMHFLDEINKLNLPTNSGLKSQENDVPIVDHELISNLIRWISTNKPPGAILCFLPGWSDISSIQYKLDINPIPNQILIPLHSKLNYISQSLIFKKTSLTSRKIILATDVAETGITVPDVVYVVDSACHKVRQWDENKGLSFMKTDWISHANLQQRKGRAGRVTNGESYHLITKQKFYKLKEYPTPEIFRISLEKSVLDGKSYSSEKAETFFGSMIQPPRISSIKKAVYDLQILGALDKYENLTPLGKKLNFFSTDPKLSKAIVYSSFFQCLGKMLAIVSAISLDSGIFYERLGNSKYIRENKLRFHNSSDLISVVNIFEKWKEHYFHDFESSNIFCKNNSLLKDKMLTLYNTVMLHYDDAAKSGLIHYTRNLSKESNLEQNNFINVDELALGVLLAGTDQLLYCRHFDFRKGRFTRVSSSTVTENDQKAHIISECVNYRRISWPSPYSTYFQKSHDMHSQSASIYDSSIISPLTVLLFSQGGINSSEWKNDNGNKVLLTINRKRNVRLICDESTANSILRFRTIMWSIIRYFIESTNHERIHSHDFNQINHYKMKMLHMLVKLLNSKSESIEVKN